MPGSDVISSPNSLVAFFPASIYSFVGSSTVLTKLLRSVDKDKLAAVQLLRNGAIRTITYKDAADCDRAVSNGIVCGDVALRVVSVEAKSRLVYHSPHWVSLAPDDDVVSDVRSDCDGDFSDVCVDLVIALRRSLRTLVLSAFASITMKIFRTCDPRSGCHPTGKHYHRWRVSHLLCFLVLLGRKRLWSEWLVSLSL